MFLNAGYGNFVLIKKIVAVVGADTSPIKRVVREAKDRGMCIDVTNGRKTRAVIIADSDHVILSPTYPETLVKRLEGVYESDKREIEEL